MNKDELTQEVCRATGESEAVIKAMGFQSVKGFLPLPPEMRSKRVFSNNVIDLNMDDAA